MAEASSIPPPPTSSRACPTCGKGIDPLRAGEVAILDTEFLYFCDRECKRAYVESSGAASALERFTADPPKVALGRSNGAHGTVVIPAPPPSGPEMPEPRSVARSRAETDPDRAPVDVVAPRSVPRVAVRQSGADGRRRGDGDDEDDEGEGGERESGHAHGHADEPEPEPVHEPETVDAHADEPPKGILALIEGKRDAIAFAGIGFGVLSWLVALAGTLADAVREPLAILAGIAWLVRVATARKDAALVHPAISAAPPLLALAAAVWAERVQSLDAETLASFAGLCAAAALFIAYHVDRALEPLAKSRQQIADALEVDVKVVRGERTLEVTPSQVKPGEQVLVDAGDVVGVDAIVAAGEATVVPWLFAPGEAPKKEGDAIVAGTKIVSGSLRLITTWAAHERAWAKLSLLPSQRIDVAAPAARSARLALERVAPIAALLAGMVAVLVFARGPEVLAVTAAAGMALCAWGTGAMVAFHHAQGQAEALAHGIVYKDARAFHDAGTADIAVVCSRGTVLMGEPEIVALEPLGSLDENRVLALAAGAETASNHPLASAILRAARARGVRIENVRNATEHAGLGVTALSANGERMVVGSRALLLDERVSVALADARVSQLESEGRSVLLVALGDKLVGLLALQDGLRAGARAAVQRLHDARIEPVLLSGEARDTCETIGRALDIDHIRPEVLPADRGAEVRALREGGHAVAVLGHPQTDDVALGAADVSVALCSAGSTPGEWTVALASDDVRHAALALGLSRICRERTRVAMVIGFAPGVLAALGIAIGVVPLIAAPGAALVAALGVLAHARR
jgi:Cu+-exporting ATPase